MQRAGPGMDALVSTALHATMETMHCSAAKLGAKRVANGNGHRPQACKQTAWLPSSQPTCHCCTFCDAYEAASRAEQKAPR